MSGGEVLPLIVGAAFLHPKEENRVLIKQALLDWVDEINPSCTMNDIRNVIQGHRGTLLEPFVLQDDDYDLVAILARLAFSELCGQSRFRVSSRETMGTSGGCVIIKNLKSYYVERFAMKKGRAGTGKSWALISGREPQAEDIDRLRNPVKISAFATVGEMGYEILLDKVRLDNLRWGSNQSLNKNLIKYSTIGVGRATLESLGLSIKIEGGTLTIFSVSPESTMQLSAHMMEKSTLVLDPGPFEHHKVRLAIELNLPEQDNMPLRIRPTLTSGYFGDWLRIETSVAPVISDSIKALISDWLMPHESWGGLDISQRMSS